MYDIIASVDFPELITDLMASFSRGDLITCLSMFLLIGLVAGLVIRSRESNIIINLFCGVAGAVPGGYVYMITIGSFYGMTGSLAASVAGAVVVLLIKRAFYSSSR